MEMKPIENIELSSIQEAAKHAMECLQKLSRKDDAFFLLTVEGKNDGDEAEGCSLISSSGSRANLVFQRMLVQAMEQHPEVLEEIIEPAYFKYKLEHFEEFEKKEKDAFLAFATVTSIKTLIKFVDRFHADQEYD